MKIRSRLLAASAFILVCIIIAVVLYIQHWIIEKEETFVPAIPASIDYLVITDTQSVACYVVTARTEIRDIIRPLTRLSNCIYDEEPKHLILFVSHGLQKYMLPISEIDFPDESQSAVKRVMNDAHRYFTYHGMVSRQKGFFGLKTALETQQGYLVYYPEDDYCYQFPSIRLKYLGKTAHDDSFTDDLPVGKFAGDDIFKPIIDLLSRQQLVYSYSKVSCVSETSFYPHGDEYVRSISIYLNNDIADATYKEISAKWKALARYPIPDAIAFMRTPNYQLEIMTRRSIDAKDKAMLLKRYGITITSSNGH